MRKRATASLRMTVNRALKARGRGAGVRRSAPTRQAMIALVLCLCLFVGSGSPADAIASPQPTDRPDLEPLIETYRGIIDEQMKRQHIPGFALALVDGDGVLWAEGFGCTDWSCAEPVTTETPFSIQSMSKSFTAVAVMMAVEQGLLDLDTPISTYLPDFTVHSLFDDRPQDLITLRMLLSHTAGFTHEAPVGNNYDLEAGTWETHVASIQETWLKFPVGQQYAYSNLGIDLAGYIVQEVSGQPFQDYLRSSLLIPLGMAGANCDIATIREMPHRAVGHASIYRQVPLVTIMPSGGCYADVNDMARYVQFHIHRGMADGRQLLASDLAEEMTAPQFRASAGANYGLGLSVEQGRYGALKVSHGGGGFGFLSMMVWYPDLEIGVTWLSNSNDHDLQGWLADDILEAVMDASGDLYQNRAAERAFRFAETPSDPAVLPMWRLGTVIRERSLEVDESATQRWRRYAGIYGLPVWGRITELIPVKADEHLVFGLRPAFEVEPGLFFTGDGEALDFRGPVPTWRNLELVRVDVAVWTAGTALAVCAIVFVGALPWAIADGLARARRRRGGRAEQHRRAWVAAVTRPVLVLAALSALTSVVVLTQYPYLLVGPMPLPLRGLSTAERVGLSLPYAAGGLTLIALPGIALTLAWGLGPRWSRIHAAATGVALIIFCLFVIL